MINQQMPLLVLAADQSVPTAAGLDALRAQRDRLLERFNKGYGFLEDLAKHVGQDSSEFERYFAEWEKINQAYKYADDRLADLVLAQSASSSTIDEAAAGISMEKMPVANGVSQ